MGIDATPESPPTFRNALRGIIRESHRIIAEMERKVLGLHRNELRIATSQSGFVETCTREGSFNVDCVHALDLDLIIDEAFVAQQPNAPCTQLSRPVTKRFAA